MSPIARRSGRVQKARNLFGQRTFRRSAVNPIIANADPVGMRTAGRHHSRRGLMKLAGGAAALGILVAGCSSSERTTASTAPSSTQPVTTLAAGDTSNGADNFYTSDRV